MNILLIIIVWLKINKIILYICLIENFGFVYKILLFDGIPYNNNNICLMILHIV